MTISEEEVRRLATLAWLDLGEDEAVVLARQIGEILERVGILAEGGLPEAPPPPAEGGAGHRGDLPGSDALVVDPESFAPAWRDGFFTVPLLSSHDDAGAGGRA